MPTCYLATAFWGPDDGPPLSLALVSEEGGEHFVELDAGARNIDDWIEAASPLVRACIVAQRAAVGSTRTAQQMAEATGDWLRRLGREGEGVKVCFGSPRDWEALLRCLRPTAFCNELMAQMTPADLTALVVSPEACALRAESLEASRARGLPGLHALAEALALRHVHRILEERARRLVEFYRSEAFQQLVALHDDPRFEPWLRGWCGERIPALGGARPVDMVSAPGGIDAVLTCLGSALNGGYA